jgi:hypothetical protein
MPAQDSVAEQLERGAEAARQLVARRTEDRALRAGPAPGILVGEGDSWLDYPGADILSVLEDDFDWEVQSVAHRGDNLESMAYDVTQLEPFRRVFERLRRREEHPRAILLSGGGNDFAGPELAMLLDHQGSGHGGINATITTELVQRRMREAWATLLGFTTQLAVEMFGAPVRTVLHGYDYAVPDGRGFLLGFGPLPGPWLEPSYARKNLGSRTAAGLEVRKRLTRDLLDQYNVMLAALVEQPGLEHVAYVDLRGTLTAADYKDVWANELHPTPRGFRTIAAKLHAALLA